MIIINQLLFFLLLTSSAYAIIDYLNAAACEDDLENIYSDCFIYDKITKDNQSLICRTYESDKCQKLYKEGCSIVRYCKDLDLETRVYVENKYSESVLQLDLICSTDEKNQPCPIANSYIIENVHNDKITNNTYINDTCKSNKCTKIAINTFKKGIDLVKGTLLEPKTTFDSKKINEEYDASTVSSRDVIAYKLAFLNSPFCSSQNSDLSLMNNTNNKKFNGFLFAIFVILFTLILN